MDCIDDGCASSVDARVGIDIPILNIPFSLSLPLEAGRSNACHHCVCSSKCTHDVCRTSSTSFISMRQNEKSVNSVLLEAEIRHFDLYHLKDNGTKENQSNLTLWHTCWYLFSCYWLRWRSLITPDQIKRIIIGSIFHSAWSISGEQMSVSTKVSHMMILIISHYDMIVHTPIHSISFTQETHRKKCSKVLKSSFCPPNSLSEFRVIRAIRLSPYYVHGRWW